MLKHRRLVASARVRHRGGRAGVAVAADGATDIEVTAAPTLTPGSGPVRRARA